METLSSQVCYVGAPGSRANNAKRRERLAAPGRVEHHLACLHGPVGLAIGSRTPPEIAVAILAELIAVRRDTLPQVATRSDGDTGRPATRFHDVDLPV